MTFRGVQREDCKSSQTLDIVLFTLLRVWFCFNLIVPVHWFFTLEVRNYLFNFDFYKSPQLRDGNPHDVLTAEYYHILIYYYVSQCNFGTDLMGIRNLYLI